MQKSWKMFGWTIDPESPNFHEVKVIEKCSETELKVVEPRLATASTWKLEAFWDVVLRVPVATQKDCIPSIKQTWFLTTCWPIEFEVVRGGKLKARKGVNVSWLEVEWMWRWGLLIGSDFGLPEAFQVLDFMLLCCRTLSPFFALQMYLHGRWWEMQCPSETQWDMVWHGQFAWPHIYACSCC